jgi:hypothetical protein
MTLDGEVRSGVLFYYSVSNEACGYFMAGGVPSFTSSGYMLLLVVNT